MSFEEDDSGPSLKELVTKNLETNGILGNIQAQLRASVFLVLEEEFKEKNIPLANKKAQQLLSSPVGRLAVSIIQDFLQCLNLEFTLAVFNPESKVTSSENIPDRQGLYSNLGSHFINKKVSENGYPFLFQLIEEMQNLKNNKTDISNNFSVCQTEITANNEKKQNNIEERDYKTTSLRDRLLQEHDDKTKSANKESEKNINNAKSIVSTKENKQCIDIKLSENSKKDELVSISIKKKENAEEEKEQSSPKDYSNASISNDESKSSSLRSEVSNSEEKDESTESEKSSEDEHSSSSRIKTMSKEEENNDESQQTADREKKEATDVEERDKEERDSTTDDDKTEVEEAIEAAEEVEEDFSVEDLLSSSTSGVSNETKDVSASQESGIPDYQESL